MYNAADVQRCAEPAVMVNKPPAFRNPLRKGIYFFNPLTIDPKTACASKQWISRPFNHPEEANDIFKILPPAPASYATAIQASDDQVVRNQAYLFL